GPEAPTVACLLPPAARGPAATGHSRGNQGFPGKLTPSHAAERGGAAVGSRRPRPMKYVLLGLALTLLFLAVGAAPETWRDLRRALQGAELEQDRKSTRLNSSHVKSS